MTICRQETIHNHLVRWSVLYFLISDLKFVETISQFHLDWVSFTGAVQWDDVLTSARLLLASVRLIYKLGSWKKVKQNQHLPSDQKDIWRKKYFLNHSLILIKLSLEHMILWKMNLSNFGVLIFSKIALDFSILGICFECADFVITNGEKSRNQRLINFASSGYYP